MDTMTETVHRLEAAVKPHLRGVLHEVAFAISLVSGTAIVCLADGMKERLTAAIYASSVALLFGTSAAYHRGRWSPRAHGIMARLDHSMIFVLIAGTYTPFSVLLLHGPLRWVVLGVVWGGALAGILLRLASGNVFRHPPRWVFVVLYVALGWVAVAVVPQLLSAGGVAVLVLVVVGGLLYSLGALVYARKKPDPSPRWFGFHEVFHAFTLAAFVTHYVAVSLAVYGA
ncbi:MAG: hemolysin family channel protein [Frankiales bacterium]|nr:hemolysin family channel protein [Frankiales bacterium]